MTEIQIKLFYDLLKENEPGNISSIHSNFLEIITKYKIQGIDEKISLRKAIIFMREIFGLIITHPEKIRYVAKRFGFLIEENKVQKNYKLKMTYRGIFELMLMPYYLYVQKKESI